MGKACLTLAPLTLSRVGKERSLTFCAEMSRRLPALGGPQGNAPRRRYININGKTSRLKRSFLETRGPKSTNRKEKTDEQTFRSTATLGGEAWRTLKFNGGERRKTSDVFLVKTDEKTPLALRSKKEKRKKKSRREGRTSGGNRGE